MNSSLLVYSVINNLIKTINTDIEIEDVDVFQIGDNRFKYLKSKEYFHIYCKKIYNDLENSYYDYSDLILFVCHQYIFNNKINLKDINNKNVNEIIKLYTREQLEKDKKFILSVIKQSIVKNLNELFKIKEDGESIIYSLIQQKFISPFFFAFIKQKNVLTDEKENVILTDIYERFIKIIQIITKTLRGGFNEQKKICN